VSAEAVVVERLVPYMKTIEPRAATGTLDELMPVAPFTTRFTKGVAWACNRDAMKQEQRRHFDNCNGTPQASPTAIEGAPRWSE
jgi:hypothetical protein